MSSVDETERELETWLDETARAMPQYVLESALESVARTAQTSPGGPFGITWLNRRLLAGAGAVAIALIAIAIGPGMLDRWGRTGPVGVAPETCALPVAGIVSWWPGDGSTEDIAGGQRAELVGGAAFGPGRVGQGFQLDGDDDFVEVADDPALDVGRRDFSVALWIWFDHTTGEQVIVEKWIQHLPTGATGWTLTKLDGNVIGFFTEDGRGNGNGVTTDPLDLPARTWIHLAARRTGGTVEIILDGERVASASNPAAVLDLDSGASLKFGHRGSPDDTPGSDDTSGFHLAGMVDEVQLSVGRALTDDEIRATYRAGAAGTCKPA